MPNSSAPARGGALGRGQGLDGKLGQPERASGAQTAQVVRLIVSQAAAADLERLREFLSDKNPDAARRIAAALAVAIQSLDTFPDRGRMAGLAESTGSEQGTVQFLGN